MSCISNWWMSKFMISLRNSSTVDDCAIHLSGKSLSRKKVSLSVSGSNLTFNGVYNLPSSICSKWFVSNLWANHDIKYLQSCSANLVNANFLELIPPVSLIVSKCACTLSYTLLTTEVWQTQLFWPPKQRFWDAKL